MGQALQELRVDIEESFTLEDQEALGTASAFGSMADMTDELVETGH